MRKNAPRKWIHAILDLLPLLVIPIFAIYSQRHEINTNVVQRQEPTYIEIEQGVINGLPNSLDNWFCDGDTMYYSDNTIRIQFEDNEILGDLLPITINESDKFYACVDIKNANLVTDYDIAITAYTDFGNELYFGQATGNNYDTFKHFYFTCEQENSGTDFVTQLSLYFSTNDVTLIKNVQFYNLTSIFGSGNEPSGTDFDTWLNGRYIAYGTHNLQYGTHLVTYNDTDIGSQFIYQMYNVTDKYFNFNKLFNMQGIYDWLQLNLFGGNAPLPVTIVWNIIVYEFFVDLIFLLYSVFMFFIDFATNMIDSFTRRNGGR